MSFHKNHTCFEQQYPIPLSVLHTCIPLSVLHTCFEQQYPIPLSVIIIFVHVLISIIFHVSSRAIKVWDFQAALDPRTPSDALCLRTLVVSHST